VNGEQTTPLAGIRVLDFSVLLPGPACTARLAWLGAEVVKVEPAGGDPARELYGGSLWSLYNRGKRSLELDLKETDQRDLLIGLVPTVDVVVEGFRPGAMGRLGVDYESLREIRADLIYCSITGFGDDGPDRARPAHDLVFLAEAGALGAPGSWSQRGRPPARPLVPVADLAAADAAVQAILAALIRRGSSGEGARMVISALDAARYATACRAGPLLWGGESPESPQHLDPANDVYETADHRHVAIAAVEPAFWRALCRVLSLETALGEGVETWSWPERQRHGGAVAEAIAHACRNHERDTLLSSLGEAGVPAGPVATLEEAFAGESGTDGGECCPSPPLPFGRPLDAAPALGQDNERLLGRAGSGRPVTTDR
jgi:crotonobetainyl-CoA:carnitine CoA-transferase CaiB-like acyl-CoA transferase